MTTRGPQVCDLAFHREGNRIKDFRGAREAACIKAGLYRLVQVEDETERYHIVRKEDQQAAACVPICCPSHSWRMRQPSWVRVGITQCVGSRGRPPRTPQLR
jgi:hypothetical protein